MLEGCYFGDVQVGDDSAEVYVRALTIRLGGADGSEDAFLPERHQVVFDEAPAPDDSRTRSSS